MTVSGSTGEPQRYEYRVRWQRVGRGQATQIMQTEKGALEKAERLMRLDEEKHIAPMEMDVHPLAGMPDLVLLALERRPVGEWAQARVFDLPEPDLESGDVEDPNAGIEAPW